MNHVLALRLLFFKGGSFHPNHSVLSLHSPKAKKEGSYESHRVFRPRL